MATQQPTAEQWSLIEARLSYEFGKVQLDCDGYLLSLYLRKISKMRLGIIPYVNGIMKGEWLLMSAASEEGRRFYPTCSRQVFNKKELARLKKITGKRELVGKISYRKMYWGSFRALKRHLIQHNDRICFVNEDVLP